ncbi:alpha/beta-hydrolase, partial [Rhizopogon salebrosus TDB-379]
VDLGYAQYQGSVDTSANITSFFRIQYAAPPVGELIWAAPQDPPVMSGVQQVTMLPNECYQALGGGCSNRSFQKLPVVVWIHGGGQVAYEIASYYDGADLVIQSNYGVVAVAV